MIFNEQDLRPNQPIPLDAVRVGNNDDARWRVVPDDVEVIDAVDARPAMPHHNTKGSRS